LIEERIVLVIAYVAIALLLLYFYFFSQFSKAIKISIVLVVTVFYFLTWQGFERVLGWPAGLEMPNEFRVLWIALEEPDKNNNEAGEIYFWIRDLDKAGLPISRPRAYSIIWSEENAKAAEEALNKLEEGEILNGSMSRNVLTGDQEKAKGEDYEDSGSPSGQQGEEPSFQFKEVAPPSLPAKGLLNN
jgi:hypothetical protein